MRDRWRHIDQYKGFIGRYKIDLTLSLCTKMNIDTVEIYNRVISGFNRFSTLICVAPNQFCYITVCITLDDKHDKCIVQHDAETLRNRGEDIPDNLFIGQFPRNIFLFDTFFPSIRIYKISI